MHELSICSAIADAVNEHAQGRRVERIRLRIGHFRQIVPETLQYCWSLQTDDSPLRNTALDVTYVEAVVRCRKCSTETTLSVPVLVCESCGSHTVELIMGEEFLIESIDVATPMPTSGERA
ncbi:MAG: hydrogenase maturation nickel metallochaperone HypA [Acidimicrobiia bacterium]|nr:hydrogenase maturation nickel metallochaperone HypA [Acidimicrobiia bacterium]